jgi:tRNA threonylcarbamoyladenosine modification (KEOPS) complex  Pcc1 subunit
LNEVSVEIEVEAGRDEARALAEALAPESHFGRAPFQVSLTEKGVMLKVDGRSLSDARVFTNSILRLLKAAKESIQAVD